MNYFICFELFTCFQIEDCIPGKWNKKYVVWDWIILGSFLLLSVNVTERSYIESSLNKIFPLLLTMAPSLCPSGGGMPIILSNCYNYYYYHIYSYYWYYNFYYCCYNYYNNCYNHYYNCYSITVTILMMTTITATTSTISTITILIAMTSSTTVATTAALLLLLLRCYYNYYYYNFYPTITRLVMTTITATHLLFTVQGKKQCILYWSLDGYVNNSYNIHNILIISGISVSPSFYSFV